MLCRPSIVPGHFEEHRTCLVPVAEVDWIGCLFGIQGWRDSSLRNVSRSLWIYLLQTHPVQVSGNTFSGWHMVAHVCVCVCALCPGASTPNNPSCVWSSSEGMELCGNCLEKNKEKTPWKVYLREGLVMLLSSLNHIVCTPGSGEILELDLKENNMPGLPLSAPLLSSSNSGFQSCSFDQLSPSGPFLISSPSEPLPIAPPSEPVLYRSNSEPEPVLYRSNSESLLYKSNAEPVLFTSNAEPVLFTTNSEPLVFTPNTVPQAFSPSPNSLAYTPLSEPLSFPSNSVPLDFNQSPEPSAFTSNSESYTYTTDSLPSDFTPTSEPPAFPPKTELVSFTQIAESLPPPVSNPEKVAKAPTKSCKKVSDCVLVDRMRTIVHQDCRIGKELFTTGIELADRYNSCYNHETIHVRRVFEAMKTLGFSASKDTMQVQVQSVRRKVKLIYGLAFK